MGGVSPSTPGGAWFPDPPAVRTIQDRLTQMQRDLIDLAYCCNRDHQYNEAIKLQAALAQLDDVDIQCADTAKWPPVVHIEADGVSVWECVE